MGSFAKRRNVLQNVLMAELALMMVHVPVSTDIHHLTAQKRNVSQIVVKDIAICPLDNVFVMKDGAFWITPALALPPLVQMTAMDMVHVSAENVNVKLDGSKLIAAAQLPIVNRKTSVMVKVLVHVMSVLVIMDLQEKIVLAKLVQSQI